MQHQNSKYYKDNYHTKPLRSSEIAVLKELLCSLDRSYYLRSLGFKPFEWQDVVARSISKRKHILASRQSGKSTIVSALPCHTAKYFAGSTSLILAPTEKQAGLNMEKVKDFIALDREYPKITRNSDSLIKLENGSKIHVVPATESAARGYSKPRCIILDEASRIIDPVYTSGIRPMLTDNPECELSVLSTPNGKSGFFYEASQRKYWDRYFIRTPFETFTNEEGVVDLRQIDEQGIIDIVEKYKKLDVKFFISPRHYSYNEQQENFYEMGMQQYLQEYLCDFVEPMDNVFTYDDLDRLSNSTGDSFDMPSFEVGDIDSSFDMLEGAI
jgi:hypothetical protein